MFLYVSVPFFSLGAEMAQCILEISVPPASPHTPLGLGLGVLEIQAQVPRNPSPLLSTILVWNFNSPLPLVPST